jgi:hypothetical protein
MIYFSPSKSTLSSVIFNPRMVGDISVHDDNSNYKFVVRTMSEETDKSEDFGKICPSCGIANPEEFKSCMMCDKDLTLTVLFLEDAFFDIELTTTEFIEYRKNYYRTRRTGKIKRFKLDKMGNINFEIPIKRFSFDYDGKREVYPLKDENYMLLKEKFETN